MTRIRLFLAILALMILSTGPATALRAQAAEPQDAAQAEPAVPAVPEPAAPAPVAPPPSKEQVERERQHEQIRQSLDGTRWELQLRAEADGKTSQDVLSFAGRTVSSDRLSKAGYTSSNYSVRLEDDLPVWETMQSNPDAGVVFWRGEVRGDTMSGTLMKQPQKGSPESFSFAATQIVAVPAAPAAPAVSAPTVVDPAPTPAKSQKRNRR